MVGEWIASYVFILLFGLGADAFRVDRARRGNVFIMRPFNRLAWAVFKKLG